MSTTIVWFRQDLRLSDNPALHAALREGAAVIPLYILDELHDRHPWALGSASRWWLHHSLAGLTEELTLRGSRLIVMRGDCLAAIRSLARQTGADAIHWNRLYEPAPIERDRRLKSSLRADGLRAESFNGALLAEPWDIATRAGDAFRVFTPFCRALRQRLTPAAPSPAPTSLPSVPPDIATIPPENWGLLPRIPWDHGLRVAWRPGERGAEDLLARFRDDALADYADGREHPDRAGTSRLSPHLHFGEISPRQILAALPTTAEAESVRGLGRSIECYERELIWREFAHHLLFHFPTTTDRPLNPAFDAFSWREGYDGMLSDWTRGRTGFPWIDAGMRELWHTGWMHNRVRMAVASMLTKNLRIPWQCGARWFWDTLVDADLASNTLGWQWSAGCGADAAPYFRIFNPVLQSQRFDPEGSYIRRWIPELAKLPPKWLHQPWLAPEEVLSASGVTLGRDYPRPIVDLQASRAEALDAFSRIGRRVHVSSGL